MSDPRLLSLFFASLFMVPVLEASQVIWGSQRFATNYLSDGNTEMTGDFLFELGTFRDGFTPTATNTSEWAANWVTAQTAVYSESTKFFTGSFAYDEPIDPFLPNKKGYIWGFDRQSSSTGSSGEWILVSSDEWRWPTGSGVTLPVYWSASSGTAIVGKVITSASGASMRTASVVLPLGPTDAPFTWLDTHLAGANASDRRWDADPDGDGRDNLMEAVLGSDPLQVDREERVLEGSVVRQNGQSFLSLKLDRTGSEVKVRMTVEASSDMITWLPSNQVVIVENSTNLFRALDRVPFSEGRKRFLRLVVRP